MPLPSQPSPDFRTGDILRQTGDTDALPGSRDRDKLGWCCGCAAQKGALMVSKTVIALSLLLAMPASMSAWAQSQPASTVYSEETPIEVLAADPAAAAVLNKDLPGLLTDAQYPIFKAMSLKAIQGASNGDLSKSDVEKTVADLQALARR